MSLNISKRRIAIVFMSLTLVVISHVFGQGQVPQREELLNGLRVILLINPGSPDVLVKLRVHSGAAFDQAGKSGQMALLGDLLFPDRATIEYFTEEMDGRLDVDVDYDSVTITLQGKANELERILDVLRNAVISTEITPEVVSRLRDSRAKIIRETAISPSTVADRAVAARLFGDFPYGRPTAGTPEDVGRIEPADLMLARDRFMNSNNATVIIEGGVTKSRAMRALRQLLGPWRKSNQLVPATFRQPSPPDRRTLVINGGGDAAEVRIAVRGVSLTDPNYLATTVLAKVAQHRWESLVPELANKPAFVRSESHFLPGMFIMGASVSTQSAADALVAAQKTMETLVSSSVSPGEMDRARNEVLAELNSMLSKPDAMTDALLDRETYRLTETRSPQTIIGNLTPADIQRVAARLFANPAAATVIMGNAEHLKTALQGRIQFEVLGEASTQPKTQPLPAKPGVTTPP